MRFLTIGFILCHSFLLLGQTDTSYLSYNQLEWSDVDQNITKNLVTRVISGTRTERDLEDLPFTIHVITAEEIKEQGYYTLVDALKHLPGIRVSQPGSGLDGETFMMRGLYGNAYAKILINDIPIKPSIVGAMPIGSQLPIRQAERIEVIYGPAATLYGADAAAGVINIILKESEYPTFAQASVETGVNDLTRVSAMFGGKIAMGKRLLKLRMYGGYTSFSDRKIKYDLNTLYNPEVYQNIIKADLNTENIIGYENRPNYIGSTGSTILSNLPHQSSYIGFSALLGSFEFYTQRLFRSDHSSIGLSPYAVSYANPQSLIGEEILTSTLIFRKEYSKWDFMIKLSGLNYTINPLSSYSYVLPTFGIATNYFLLSNNLEPGARKIDSLYLAGPRYVSGKSSDISFETQFNVKAGKNINFSAGLQTIGGFGDAIERFNRFPGIISDRFIDPPVLPSTSVLYSELSAFLEGYANFGPFKAIAGAQVFLRADSLVVNDPEYNPRIGLLYRATPSFSVRASYSSAFRYPAAFFSGSSYQVSKEGNFIAVKTGSADIEPERTISYETGIRLSTPLVKVDASIYYTRTTNYINYDFNQGEIEGALLWGYQNDPDSFNQLIGAQLSLQIENLWPAIKLSSNINLNFSEGKERILQIFLENFDQRMLQDIPVIRAQPDLMAHIGFSFMAGKHIKILLNNTLMTKSWTRNKYRISTALAAGNREQLLNQGYYTLDFRSLIQISRQLSAYIDISNFFNTKYAGIDASFEPDVLLYNPQSLRMTKFGVNFTFN